LAAACWYRPQCPSFVNVRRADNPSGENRVSQHMCGMLTLSAWAAHSVSLT
jgi:hypothetical protein